MIRDMKSLMDHAARSEAFRAETLRLIERTTGQTPPNEPFAAVITGIANVTPDGAPDPPNDFEDCFNPAGGIADPLTGFHLYSPTALPPGVLWRRYRWRAQWGNLDSEGCGWRDVEGTLRPWNQAWYAINTAEVSADPDLDYDPLEPGSVVLMAFGQLEGLPGVEPAWGFFFHGKPDPAGILPCPRINPDPLGCCRIVNFPEVQQICMTESDCLSAGGTWQLGVPCPVEQC